MGSWRAWTVALAAAFAITAATPAAAQPVFGVKTAVQQRLVSFDTQTPGSITSDVAISGLQSGETIVGMDFDASVAWPIYDWMGVSKAALESVARYLARDLGRDGIRVNLVSAGPLRTMAAKGIPGFSDLAGVWQGRAPLGWDVTDPDPVARAVAFLLSDWASAISGEILHVDGGFHAMGAPIAGQAEPAD